MGKTLRTLLLAGVLTLVMPLSLYAQDMIALVNPSFEEAGGQSSPCADVPNDFSQVPGWSMDGTPQDSGVAPNGNATDGLCGAWLFSQDPDLWQLTNHTIQAGETYTLMVDARTSWLGTLFDIMLYYDDNGSRVVFATTEWDFEGVIEDMITVELTASSDDHPEAMGHKLGIAIKNATPGSTPGTYHDNAYNEIDNVRLSVSGGTAVEAEMLPVAFSLDQNYPNPFNPETTIRYTLKQVGALRLTVHDALGRTVRTLVEATQAPGAYDVRWDGRYGDGVVAPSGVYLYRLSFGEGVRAATETRVMTLLR